MAERDSTNTPVAAEALIAAPPGRLLFTASRPGAPSPASGGAAPLAAALPGAPLLRPLRASRSPAAAPRAQWHHRVL